MPINPDLGTSRLKNFVARYHTLVIFTAGQVSSLIFLLVASLLGGK
jgi:hypothetical protein